MPETTTDCRDEVGITVSLVDALIAIARVLAKRDLGAREVQEALEDLRQDEDIRKLLRKEEEHNGKDE